MQRSESTLSAFTAVDGDMLAVQHWPVPPGVRPRGVVVVVHGLGEHAGRHERLARHLTAWGFAVHGYDQCGHGESDGTRGWIPSSRRLINDLQDMVDSARRRLAPGEHLIVLGHSMGALVVASWLLARQPAVDGAVLSAPPFEPVIGPLQRLLLKFVPRIAPNLTLPHGYDPEALSHDPEVIEAYRRDPLVHHRISARLARFIVNAGPRVLARAQRWRTPTLMLWGGEDTIIRQRACRAFAQAAPPGLVTAQCFAQLRHEVFNELDAEPVYEALRNWLDRRFPMLTPAPRAAGAAPASPAPPHRPPRAAASPSSAGPSPASSRARPKTAS